MNKYILIVISLFSFHSIALSDLNNCETKVLQVLKPNYPSTIYQGYAIVKFDIDTDASISNIKATESMCAISRDINGKIIFKECPFFKSTSVAASKYLKYAIPKDSNGKLCKIEGKTIKYNFSLYSFKVINNNFLLREENNSDNLDPFLNENEKYINTYNMQMYFLCVRICCFMFPLRTRIALILGIQ